MRAISRLTILVFSLALPIQGFADGQTHSDALEFLNNRNDSALGSRGIGAQSASQASQSSAGSISQQISGNRSGGRGAGEAGEAINEAGKNFQSQIEEFSKSSNEGLQESTSNFIGETLPGLSVDEGPSQEAVAAVAAASQASLSANGGAGVGAAIVDSIVQGIGQLAQTRVNILRTVAQQFSPQGQASRQPASSSQVNNDSLSTRIGQNASASIAGPGPIGGAGSSSAISSVPRGIGASQRAQTTPFSGVDTDTVYNIPEGLVFPQ